MDAAVKAVFAALIWHTQQLRDDLEKYSKYNASNLCMLGKFHAMLSADFFQIQLFQKNLSGALSGCQRVWIQLVGTTCL